MAMNETSLKPRTGLDDAYLKSMFYEQLVEHVFVSEVLQEIWYYFGETVEVLRSEVDSSGYDVVFDCNGILRHVQLKTSKPDAKTSGQKVNVALASKPGGCIVWLVRHEDRQSCRMRLSYLFFGGEPGQPLPSLEGLKVAKHTKANAEGVKTERSAVRVVPKSRFVPISSTRELVGRLFGLRERASEDAMKQIEAATAESEVDDV
jgi:hypothetical protein